MATMIKQICDVVIDGPSLLNAALATVENARHSKMGRPPKASLRTAAAMVKEVKAELKTLGCKSKFAEAAIDIALSRLKAQTEHEIRRACMEMGDDPEGDIATNLGASISAICLRRTSSEIICGEHPAQKSLALSSVTLCGLHYPL